MPSTSAPMDRVLSSSEEKMRSSLALRSFSPAFCRAAAILSLLASISSLVAALAIGTRGRFLVEGSFTLDANSLFLILLTALFSIFFFSRHSAGCEWHMRWSFSYWRSTP